MSKESTNSTLGANIAHLVQVLALKKQWSKAYATQHIADTAGFGTDIVYKWRQNRISPSSETLATLLRIGCREAGLQRDWGLAMVKAARYADGVEIVDELWEPQPQVDVPHNLPKPTYNTFVGRATEQQRLLDLLSVESSAPLIMINGLGGVGKTALVLHTAYRCLEASLNPLATSPGLQECPTFSVIVFVSAKQKYITADGILPRAYAPTTMRAIFREIAYVLDIDIAAISPEELPGHLRHMLSRQRTLLIVDNLETVEDKDRVLAFLLDLPTAVKVVITTREQRSYTPLQIDCLSRQESVDLIQQEAEYQRVQLKSEEIERLHIGTGGIPAAIIYGVGQLAVGRTLNNVLQRLADHEGDVARFFFQDSVAPLRGRPAHRLLMATAIFDQPPQCHFACEVAGLEEESTTANDASVQLLRLSLIHRDQERFSLHPLTREYTLAELESQIEFELEARQRWLAIYRHFVVDHGGPDWGEWHLQYQPLEAEWDNLYALLQWCIQQRRYQDVLHFWRYLRDFLLIYGHMADQHVLLEWLEQESERRGDWSTHGEVLLQKALTVILLEQEDRLEVAGQWLQRAWALRVEVSPIMHGYLADYLAAWHICCQRTTDAQRWLAISADLPTQTQSEERLTLRQQTHLTYWRAICANKSGQQAAAETLFQEAQRQSSAIGWTRLYYCSQRWLAEIALNNNELEGAEQLLLECLHIFADNREQRQTAFCKYALAQLAHQRGDLEAARIWAGEAETLMERIGMQGKAINCVVNQPPLEVA